MGQDSAIGVATRYGVDGPGIESRWGQDFPHPSTPALGLTHPIQWVLGHSLGYSGRDVVLTTHPHPAPRLKKEYSNTSIPLMGLHGLF